MKGLTELQETKELVSDLISRQAAIDSYGDWYVEEGTEEGFIGTVKQLLEGFPSAQPERKKGKWIKRKKGALGYDCSCCGKSAISNHFDYCPNCGADMRDEQDK